MHHAAHGPNWRDQRSAGIVRRVGVIWLTLASFDIVLTDTDASRIFPLLGIVVWCAVDVAVLCSCVTGPVLQCSVLCRLLTSSEMPKQAFSGFSFPQSTKRHYFSTSCLMPSSEQPGKAFSDVKKLALLIDKGKKTLPTTLPLAPKDSQIVKVFARIPVPKDPREHWEVFDRRFNALFGEDTRDKATGRLPNLLRGKHGLDLVVLYIHDMITAGSLQWDSAKPKLERILKEMTELK